MLERFNAALDLVEDAIRAGEALDVVVLSRCAGTSEHHFRRTFSSLAGIPIGEYVRRRRMTLAAADVLTGELTLLDVAVKHGYGSTEAFSRAFRAVHGVGAGQDRRTRPRLVSQPRVSFHLTVEGSSSMQYRIVGKQEFRVVGLKARVPLIHRGRNSAMEDFVEGIDPALTEQIGALSDQEPDGVVSVTDALDDSREEGSELDYWHAAITTGPAPVGLEEMHVPAGTWLVLTTSHSPYPEGLQQMWPDAYAEWFPANPWRTRPGPDLLRAQWHDDDTADAELWLPIEPDPT
ncbi:helix-turn-helix domain-containing protein [Streptomyces sp. DG2A-72]|uniref:AraC family transcriptional regulator n=1 Tax=Streptomyces sp. DG2A-72 TaxID=3051386 RepID=UPI00265BDC32|nr:helix-turn-helix domain-containing protein [Streptomyces sp. DG2A-72]MDO0934514.1 helix-turn-helix domain-containing protein [Streptomyces sp. DG2A-72]